MADRAAAYGAHYLRERVHTEADLATIQAYARRVPGLHAPDCGEEALTFADECDRLTRSGLFDAAYDVTKNPDVPSRTRLRDAVAAAMAFGRSTFAR